MSKMVGLRRVASGALVAAGLTWTTNLGVSAHEPTLFIRSAVEHPDDTVTLPLFKGTSRGRTVWYVVLDASSGAQADRLGVNRSQKLANARGPLATQKVTIRGGLLDFSAALDFTT